VQQKIEKRNGEKKSIKLNQIKSNQINAHDSWQYRKQHQGGSNSSSPFGKHYEVIPWLNTKEVTNDRRTTTNRNNSNDDNNNNTLPSKNN
jgi:hypothetical protein